ncbi:hypothetical protein LFM09_10295 [Lentzea alba]|uniref:hypothetical protein n=1 Tax=Lentzea alba TaxID=2714351 RepID=UPI0039BF02B2
MRGRTLPRAAVAGLALFGWWGASTWLPAFLQGDRGVPAATAAVFVIVLNLGMFVGYHVFGLIADRTALLWLGPLFAFFAAFAGIFGAYQGELFPTRVRTTGAGFCFNVGRGVSAFAPLTLGALAAAAGFGTGLPVSAGFVARAAIAMTFLPDLRRGQG